MALMIVPKTRLRQLHQFQSEAQTCSTCIGVGELLLCSIGLHQHLWYVVNETQGFAP
jgi:hypothetical protein